MTSVWTEPASMIGVEGQLVHKAASPSIDSCDLLSTSQVEHTTSTLVSTVVVCPDMPILNFDSKIDSRHMKYDTYMYIYDIHLKNILRVSLEK